MQLTRILFFIKIWVCHQYCVFGGFGLFVCFLIALVNATTTVFSGISLYVLRKQYDYGIQRKISRGTFPSVPWSKTGIPHADRQILEWSSRFICHAFMAKVNSNYMAGCQISPFFFDQGKKKKKKSVWKRETTQQFISPFHVPLLCKSFTPRITQSTTKFLMQHFLCKKKKRIFSPQKSLLPVLWLARASSYFTNGSPKILLPSPKLN